MPALLSRQRCRRTIQPIAEAANPAPPPQASLAGKSAPSQERHRRRIGSKHVMVVAAITAVMCAASYRAGDMFFGFLLGNLAFFLFVAALAMIGL